MSNFSNLLIPTLKKWLILPFVLTVFMGCSTGRLNFYSPRVAKVTHFKFPDRIEIPDDAEKLTVQRNEEIFQEILMNHKREKEQYESGDKVLVGQNKFINA